MLLKMEIYFLYTAMTHLWMENTSCAVLKILQIIRHYLITIRVQSEEEYITTILSIINYVSTDRIIIALQAVMIPVFLKQYEINLYQK